ncbi:Acetylglutamate kinase [Frankliniella fusca]|uniref:Acetylglutamate kinase n=1 Tax=Frankliniella fusca TaxID=407009 RepID=A0AAE1I0G4_9NEOP|nr:Acetylglutamate kinase [Frankliniella fusca]
MAGVKSVKSEAQQQQQGARAKPSRTSSRVRSGRVEKPVVSRTTTTTTGAGKVNGERPAAAAAGWSTHVVEPRRLSAAAADTTPASPPPSANGNSSRAANRTRVPPPPPTSSAANCTPRPPRATTTTTTTVPARPPQWLVERRRRREAAAASLKDGSAAAAIYASRARNPKLFPPPQKPNCCGGPSFIQDFKSALPLLTHLWQDAYLASSTSELSLAKSGDSSRSLEIEDDVEAWKIAESLRDEDILVYTDFVGPVKDPSGRISRLIPRRSLLSRLSSILVALMGPCHIQHRAPATAVQNMSNSDQPDDHQDM